MWHSTCACLYVVSNVVHMAGPWSIYFLTRGDNAISRVSSYYKGVACPEAEAETCLPPFPDNPAPRNDHRYIVHADVFQQHTSSKTSCLPTQPQAVRAFPICDRHPYTQFTSHSTTNGVSEELFVNEVTPAISALKPPSISPRCNYAYQWTLQAVQSS